jgi:hypothetical protein
MLDFFNRDSFFGYRFKFIHESIDCDAQKIQLKKIIGLLLGLMISFKGFGFMETF